MFVKNPEYFITIANERSISKSAEKLYLSQPYLSQYLAKLEANLGVTLLDRSHTPLRLMPAGELFLAYLESQRYLDRQLEDDLRQLQDHRQQTLHIGVATWRGSILLPDLLPAFSQRCPDVKVVLHELPAPQLGLLYRARATAGLGGNGKARQQVAVEGYHAVVRQKGLSFLRQSSAAHLGRTGRGRGWGALRLGLGLHARRKKQGFAALLLCPLLQAAPGAPQAHRRRRHDYQVPKKSAQPLHMFTLFLSV